MLSPLGYAFPGLLVLALRSPSNNYHAAPTTPLTPSPPPQKLRRARNRVAEGRLLPEADSEGPYGTRFWERVALEMPGRDAAGCLDGHLSSRHATIARFKAGAPPRDSL